eukprot:CAMPEP_0175053550 /NCGR_PEP_ID=MMETSP0052_2-20121109/8996_1 /TAXON_ID=51329 ORGANISM="Polytomella parva, Strain SAG 63-3" /NCGR_SAMPLE_ID=MMETSP0052_2 /ASSEMBLY_ACC=CAM_ASM_000194 /LENGTH=298 /DNA_ID=CAMNT_0016318115 /DNA_START=284 /DNA_END=1176 /DNA_ORIENTATION=-
MSMEAPTVNRYSISLHTPPPSDSPPFPLPSSLSLLDPTANGDGIGGVSARRERGGCDDVEKRSEEERDGRGEEREGRSQGNQERRQEGSKCSGSSRDRLESESGGDRRFRSPEVSGSKSSPESTRKLHPKNWSDVSNHSDDRNYHSSRSSRHQPGRSYGRDSHSHHQLDSNTSKSNGSSNGNNLNSSSHVNYDRHRNYSNMCHNTNHHSDDKSILNRNGFGRNVPGPMSDLRRAFERTHEKSRCKSSSPLSKDTSVSWDMKNGSGFCIPWLDSVRSESLDSVLDRTVLDRDIDELLDL